MGRIMAADVGHKRTGIAVSDELQISTRPLTTLNHTSQEELLNQLLLLIKEYQAEALILGIPLHLDGEDASQAAPIRELGKQLLTRGVIVNFEDESFSSQTAQRLQHGDKFVKKTERAIDAMAAKVILDRFLLRKQG